MEILQYIIASIVFLGTAIFITLSCALFATYYEELKKATKGEKFHFLSHYSIVIISPICATIILIGFAILFKKHMDMKGKYSPQYEQITEPVYRQVK